MVDFEAKWFSREQLCLSISKAQIRTNSPADYRRWVSCACAFRWSASLQKCASSRALPASLEVPHRFILQIFLQINILQIKKKVKPAKLYTFIYCTPPYILHKLREWTEAKLRASPFLKCMNIFLYMYILYTSVCFTLFSGTIVVYTIVRFHCVCVYIQDDTGSFPLFFIRLIKLS